MPLQTSSPLFSSNHPLSRKQNFYQHFPSINDLPADKEGGEFVLLSPQCLNDLQKRTVENNSSFEREGKKGKNKKIKMEHLNFATIELCSNNECTYLLLLKNFTL